MSTMDRYNLLRLLGKGAAGAVFLAEDRLLGGRLLALKRIRAQVDDLLRAAFEREFSTMASLSLPGVARVFDFGIMEGKDGQPGGPFFTRSYIEGIPLDMAVTSKSTAARIRLIARVASVITPLHRVGVVHGDIKPGNAIIDARGNAYVIDFGLSRVVGEHHRSNTAVSGTPPFMAPELIRGKAPSVRADIYALGATLWTVLTGEYPFAELGRAAFAAKLEGERPKSPTSTDPVVNAGLEVAIRALERDPLDRFPTVDEFIVALDEIAPPEQSRENYRGFVAPRPRGYETILSDLENSVDEVIGLGRGSGKSKVVLVQAPPGGGKSTLLRELKWRLQIRRSQVIEIAIRNGDTFVPLVSLLQHAAILAQDDDETIGLAESAMKDIHRGRFNNTQISDAIAGVFSAIGKRSPIVLLVDDIDNAEDIIGAILRSAIHAEIGRGVVVVTSSSDENASAAKELQPSRVIRVPPLNIENIANLASDTLGSVDSTVVEALEEHTLGLPAALVDALAALAFYSAPTAADVRELALGKAWLSIARSRLHAVSPDCIGLLNGLAVIGRSLPRDRVDPVLKTLGISSPDTGEIILMCEEAGLVVNHAGGLALSDRAVSQALLTDLGLEKIRETASLLVLSDNAPDLPIVIKAGLAVMAKNEQMVRDLVPQAVSELMAIGANSAAVEMSRALLTCATGDLARDTLVSLAKLHDSMGVYEEAVELSRKVLDDSSASSKQRFDAAMIASQSLRALARFDEVISLLATITEDKKPSSYIQSELAKVYLRLGDYEATSSAVQKGLEHATDRDLVQVELLTSLGLVKSYQGDHVEAREHYEAALRLARKVGSKLDEANALTSLAVGHYHASDYQSAKELFAQSLEIARELGDIGSMANFSVNLGATFFYLGEPARAAEHYQAAAKLARRAGRVSTDVQSRVNLALLHIYFGLYERARVELAEVLRDAKTAGFKYLTAQATGALGDLAAHLGDIEIALSHYNAAISRYIELGQHREVAEAHLDAAEALLNRENPVDGSIATDRLATARDYIDRDKLEDFRLRMNLLTARARAMKGDIQGAIAQFDEVIKKSRESHDLEIEWKALASSAEAHELQGAEYLAKRYWRMAVEILEQLSMGIPREHRDAFWHDSKRREVKQRATYATDNTQSNSGIVNSQTIERDTKKERLLEIIKRLAGEHNLDRLLERITESAVDLSGAERGFVLLVDESGKLQTRTVSSANSEKEDPHVVFSQSIAEAVLIDGDPIITVDASDDRRLDQFLSVHQLMLRSVACLPVRGRSGTVGVLYLEHRRHRGRFSDADIDLLFAFADQAAIALENARLLAENERKRSELARLNQELDKARQGMEELLIARTEELEEAKRELGIIKQDLLSKHYRHNMIGRSAPMHRVFETIDRLRNNSVPVVIQGESGTGKELVARAIHYSGPNAKAPFVSLNCVSIPETLLESELFGHVKGAFSGADRDRQGMIMRASGGTLFLDEVGDMPLKMQVDLLRVIQEGVVRPVGSDHEERVNIRFIAASNTPLSHLVDSKRFREDLYYRLNVVEINLPPLRDRREDIPLLCDHFLQTFAEKENIKIKRISKPALDALCNHSLPGNVRQLEHILLNAFVLMEGTSINLKDLALDELSFRPKMVTLLPAPSMEDLHSIEEKDAHRDVTELESYGSFRTAEKHRILEALEANGWNKVRTAKALGIARRTLYRRLREYELL